MSDISDYAEEHDITPEDVIDALELDWSSVADDGTKEGIIIETDDLPETFTDNEKDAHPLTRFRQRLDTISQSVDAVEDGDRAGAVAHVVGQYITDDGTFADDATATDDVERTPAGKRDLRTHTKNVGGDSDGDGEFTDDEDVERTPGGKRDLREHTDV